MAGTPKRRPGQYPNRVLACVSDEQLDFLEGLAELRQVQVSVVIRQLVGAEMQRTGCARPSVARPDRMERHDERRRKRG